MYEEASEHILEEARARVIAAIDQTADAHVTDPSALQQDIRRALGRYFNEVTQRKPVILPVVMECEQRSAKCRKNPVASPLLEAAREPVD